MKKQIKTPFEDYYFGIIRCSKAYYQEITKANEEITNPLYKTRHLGNLSKDPFENRDEEDATIIGIPTLLYHDGELYYDMLYSIYNNELSYQINEENDLGISLDYTEPLEEWEPQILAYLSIQALASMQNNKEIISKLPYFIFWNTEMNRYDFTVNDPNNLENFKDYYQAEILKLEISAQDNYDYLSHFYLGVITVKENSYSSPKITNRFLEVEDMYIDYNPFTEQTKEEAVTCGVPTLLYEKDGTYYDLRYSRYPNEITYTLGQYNHMGIHLEHVEPFLQHYSALCKKPYTSLEQMEREDERIHYAYPYSLYYDDETKMQLVYLYDENPLYQFHHHWLAQQKTKTYKKDGPYNPI